MADESKIQITYTSYNSRQWHFWVTPSIRGCDSINPALRRPIAYDVGKFEDLKFEDEFYILKNGRVWTRLAHDENPLEKINQEVEKIRQDLERAGIRASIENKVKRSWANISKDVNAEPKPFA